MPTRQLAAPALFGVALLVMAPAGDGGCGSPPSGPPRVLAAGDIAGGGTGDDLTADLLDAHPSGIVLTLGDNAYSSGTLTQFNNQYQPSWGRNVDRTYPSVGNHDYDTAKGAGYDAYFRPKVPHPIGALGKHWYSFDYAGWHVVALNSNCSAVGGCGYGSEQASWLEADLSAHATDCTLAYWHHPRFSSGSLHGSSTATRDLYEILHNHGADLILTGHDHHYERFAPQDAFGSANATGPTQFVVGTGGASLRGMGTIRPNSITRAGNVYGVLMLTLSARSYAWQFLPASGYSYTDSGQADCVGQAQAPPGCGLGPELAVLLPSLAWLRRRLGPRSRDGSRPPRGR